ncbi:MAG: beta-galactosidase small subunit [Clostridia bacterium]|nr:beta-galactosidase small subunit [Clostridia bacterium]
MSFENGLLSYYEKDGNVLISSPIKLNAYRAPIDNDGIINWNERWIKKWDEILLKHFEFLCHETKVTKSDDVITVAASGKFAPISKYVGFETEITYKIHKNGEILVSIHQTPYGRMTEVLPRLGVKIEMDKAFKNVTWYGRGEDENYVDRKAHTNFGLYTKNIDDLNFQYDIPQECGTRIDNSFVSVKSENAGLSVIGSDNFTFSYHDFTLENLTDARHRNELKKSNKNYLYIDYQMRGLGSHSCGPNPEEQYELRPHEYRFVFMLSGKTKEGELLKLSRKNLGIKTEKLSDTYTYEIIEGRINVIECNINND